MRGSILLAPIFIAAAIVSAAAAGLTGADYGYLREHFGIRNDSAGIARLEPAEAATLHATINDPAFASHPVARDDNVARYLYEVETCGTWQPTHQGEACPRVFHSTDPAVEHGYAVADRNCHACHLTGTTTAPSFYKLSRMGGWDAAKIADALGHGHAMSPITLQPQDFHDLAAYIATLK